MKKQLKSFVNDNVFITKMNSAFADLRADYELDLDTSKEKIDELKQLHVDHKNNLANLISLSIKSSGLLTGLRGTGKTHLFLLARNNINENIIENKTLCIYLNLKRLHIPEKYDQELFNRIISLFLYNELVKQLVSLLKDLKGDSYLQKFLLLFNNDKKDFIKSFDKAVEKISIFKGIIKSGSQTYSDLDKGSLNSEDFYKELIDIKSKICNKLDLKSPEVSYELNLQYAEELSKKMSFSNTFVKFLNIDDVRNQLVDILRILNLKSITFYIDEWEKLYYNIKSQEYLSFYIDRLNDNPIYFWIGYVPYRGKLYYLDNGADLQHTIDLDDSLVYESSESDALECISYFRNFINNRLNRYLTEYQIDYKALFNIDKKLQTLVIASMGNSRDFGTMLLKCWSEYQNYISGVSGSGGRYKYLSDDMINKSIKSDGDKKLSNIKDEKDVMAALKDIEDYCITKKSSHFAIEESRENIEMLSNKVFSDLVYHRVIHLRKKSVPPKDMKIQDKLTIYALNYASTYDLHKRDKKFEFITKYEEIHDRVRRYIYKPSNFINNLKIKQGQIFPCKSCNAPIDIDKMKGAWSTNSCPFCAGEIYNKQSSNK